jgi:ribosomal protein L12E/L44/L45/RPP1/RPP2
MCVRYLGDEFVNLFGNPRLIGRNEARTHEVSLDPTVDTRAKAMQWLGAQINHRNLQAVASAFVHDEGVFWTPGSVAEPLRWRYYPTHAMTFTEHARYLPVLCSLLNKPRWWEKIRNSEIVAKWRAEATKKVEPEPVTDYFAQFEPVDTDEVKLSCGCSVAAHAHSDEHQEDQDGSASDADADAEDEDEDFFKLTQREFDVVMQELEYISREEMIRIPALTDLPVSATNPSAEDPIIITPITSPGVFISDNAVPESLRIALLQAAAPLEAHALEAGRWHPGSDGQVLDLVHPSWYCAASGKTMFFFTPNAVAGEHVLEWPEPESTNASSTTQWIPSDVYIDKDGGVHFESYINNLSVSDHPELCALVAAVLRHTVPMIEYSYGSMSSFGFRPRVDRFNEEEGKKDFFFWRASEYL